MGSVIKVVGVSKAFRSPAGEFQAIRKLSIEVGKGEFLGIMGHSGSGKSTLLNLMGGIEHADEGEVLVLGKALKAMNESTLAKFRGRNLGIVFQFFQLMPTLTLVENVVLAMDLVGTIPKTQRRTRALGLLEQMGVAVHGKKLPSQISGGEQQRVAIARALANDPSVLIADEPTGNLDSQNSAHIREIFKACAQEGRTVILATHEAEAVSDFSRLIQLEDGVVMEDAHA